MSVLTKQELIERLRTAIAAVGSQDAFAQQHSISTAYISDVLRNRREPGKKILDALGLDRVVYYQVQTANKTTDTAEPSEHLSKKSPLSSSS